jgi:hypothetical protein
MAEPDNVARLIAAGSAVATALNMSVSIATYRRKRPTVKVHSPAIRQAIVTVPAGGVRVTGGRHVPRTRTITVPSLSAELRNRSEVDVKITAATVILFAEKWEPIRNRRARGQKRLVETYFGRCALTMLTTEQYTLEPFGRGYMSWRLEEPPQFANGLHPAKAAVSVTLSNGHTAESGRIPIPRGYFACQCTQCAAF